MTPTPEGYLRASGIRIARTGSMNYAPGETPVQSSGGAPVVISRGEDELFDPAFLDSLIGRPVTLGHPPDFVGIDSHSDLSVGTILSAARSEDGTHVVCDLILVDRAAIAAVGRGIRELSVGYDAQYSQDAPGVGRQHTLRANHLAIVPNGRCGQSCCLDSQPAPEVLPMTFKEKLFAAVGKVIDQAQGDPETIVEIGRAHV